MSTCLNGSHPSDPNRLSVHRKTRKISETTVTVTAYKKSLDLLRPIRSFLSSKQTHSTWPTTILKKILSITMKKRWGQEWQWQVVSRTWRDVIGADIGSWPSRVWLVTGLDVLQASVLIRTLPLDMFDFYRKLPTFRQRKPPPIPRMSRSESVFIQYVILYIIVREIRCAYITWIFMTSNIFGNKCN